MLNPTYHSSSTSLRRSISTPGTLFALKSLNIDSESDNFLLSNNKYQSVTTIFRLMNKITPEGLAKQLTLIDWSIFSLITRNELKPGQWTSQRKHVLSPNVVAFTRRFNNITFWVIDEILSLKTPKQRAEVISYFIKVSNYLVELKNLHSSYAIKSALTSVSIHRLHKTWACLSKKDRQIFEKICDLFSESKNNNQLRIFMESAIKSPRNPSCIPNLATFLRDIIHIDCVYPLNNECLSSHRKEKLESIYSFIEKCQQSNYENIDLIEDVYDYLSSFCYIEELQKFREDSYYKISQKLEPLENQDFKNKNKLSNVKFNSHYDIRALQSSEFYLNNQHNSSYELDSSSINNTKNVLNKSLNEVCFKSKELNPNFKPCHRKTNSLETGTAYLSNKNNLRNLKINLIDDSFICDIYSYPVNNYATGCDKKPTLEMLKSNKSNNSVIYFNEDDTNSLEDLNDQFSKNLKYPYTNKDLIYKGLINRKTILKDRKNPSITFWFNYYLGLTNDSLLFFSTKSYCQTKGFNSKPMKTLPLMNWSAYMEDNYSSKRNMFTLADHSCSTVYRIKTKTEIEAKEWVKLINEAIVNLKKVYFI